MSKHWWTEPFVILAVSTMILGLAVLGHFTTGRHVTRNTSEPTPPPHPAPTMAQGPEVGEDGLEGGAGVSESEGKVSYGQTVGYISAWDITHTGAMFFGMGSGWEIEFSGDGRIIITVEGQGEAVIEYSGASVNYSGEMPVEEAAKAFFEAVGVMMAQSAGWEYGIEEVREGPAAGEVGVGSDTPLSQAYLEADAFIAARAKEHFGKEMDDLIGRVEFMERKVDGIGDLIEMDGEIIKAIGAGDADLRSLIEALVEADLAIVKAAKGIQDGVGRMRQSQVEDMLHLMNRVTKLEEDGR